LRDGIHSVLSFDDGWFLACKKVSNLVIISNGCGARWLAHKTHYKVTFHGLHVLKKLQRRVTMVLITEHNMAAGLLRIGPIEAKAPSHARGQNGKSQLQTPTRSRHTETKQEAFQPRENSTCALDRKHAYAHILQSAFAYICVKFICWFRNNIHIMYEYKRQHTYFYQIMDAQFMLQEF
jgi:hypothetical protein